jgi:tRNA (guanine-N7-)-methyltransferase
MTKGQARAYTADLNRYHTSVDEWNNDAAPSPVGAGVEVGFGMGQGLLHWAQQTPDWRLLGIELFRPGVGSVAAALAKQGIENVGLIEEPAQEVFAMLSKHSIDEVRIYFPDPWPKKRHAKRRLIQSECIAQIAQSLKPSGLLRIATDWDPYAQWIREVMSGQDQLACQLDQTVAADDLSTIPRTEHTKFEARGRKLGHQIHDLIYCVSDDAGKKDETTVSK